MTTRATDTARAAWPWTSVATVGTCTSVFVTTVSMATIASTCSAPEESCVSTAEAAREWIC